MTRILGVDFSGASDAGRKIWIAEGRPDGSGALELLSCVAAIDLPVSGDPTYGVKGDLGLGRQFLHAYALRFDHPLTGNRIEVESPLPAELDGALARARDS